MARGDKARKKKWLERKNSFSRKTGFRGKPFKRLLIVCEGEKTEREYFEQFMVTSVDIEVVGTGYNTMSLVKETLRLKREAEKNDEPYDQVWCVFDRDSFPSAHVDNAWHAARKQKLKTALSNEAFELWFLLHFDYITAAHSRHQYQQMLSVRLGRKYRKNDPEVYYDLISRQKQAIENAQKLMRQYEPRQPSKDNPCTEVYLLVLELNRQK
ncbi:MAG: RloB family protein [Desulfobacterales bacterium]